MLPVSWPEAHCSHRLIVDRPEILIHSWGQNHMETAPAPVTKSTRRRCRLRPCRFLPSRCPHASTCNADTSLLCWSLFSSQSHADKQQPSYCPLQCHQTTAAPMIPSSGLLPAPLSSPLLPLPSPPSFAFPLLLLPLPRPSPSFFLLSTLLSCSGKGLCLPS